MNLNKIFIIGNLTKDPEVRSTKLGKKVATFGIATNRYWKNQSGIKECDTEFHNIVAWEGLAEIANNYLRRGDLALIEGRVKTRQWEDKNKNIRNRFEIIAEKIQLGPNKKNEDNVNKKDNEEKEDDIDDSEINSVDDLPF